MAGLVQPHPADNETIATVMQRHGDTAHTRTHSLGQQEAVGLALSPSFIYSFIYLPGTGIGSASQATRARLAVVEALHSTHIFTTTRGGIKRKWKLKKCRDSFNSKPAEETFSAGI